MTALDPRSLLAPGRTLRPATDKVLSALPPNDQGAPYDPKAAIYDRVVGARAYNRIMWGTSTAAYRAIAAARRSPPQSVRCSMPDVEARCSRPAPTERHPGLWCSSTGRSGCSPARAPVSTGPRRRSCRPTCSTSHSRRKASPRSVALRCSTSLTIHGPHSLPSGASWRPAVDSWRRCSSPTAPPVAPTCAYCGAPERWARHATSLNLRPPRTRRLETRSCSTGQARWRGSERQN